MEGRQLFRFFISRPLIKQRSSKSPSSSVYGYSDVDDVPHLIPQEMSEAERKKMREEMPDVVLFGGMTQSYCKSLAVAIYHCEGVRMRVPSSYEHPGFHGDEIKLPYKEFIRYMQGYFGNLRSVPTGAVLSMTLFFEHLGKKALVATDELKNPLSPH